MLTPMSGHHGIVEGFISGFKSWRNMSYSVCFIYTDVQKHVDKPVFHV